MVLFNFELELSHNGFKTKRDTDIVDRISHYGDMLFGEENARKIASGEHYHHNQKGKCLKVHLDGSGWLDLANCKSLVAYVSPLPIRYSISCYIL